MEKRKSRPPAGAPAVERIVGWSVRHRAYALAGWLGLMVAALLASGLVTGPGARPEDPGEAGRARRVLDAQPTYEPPVENVLIQARDAALPFRSDPGCGGPPRSWSPRWPRVAESPESGHRWTTPTGSRRTAAPAW